MKTKCEKHEKHKWTFPARFRTGAYSWKASRLACQRLREAVSEIKKVAKKDPVLGAEGKWFATAKELKFFDLALELANRSPCDPKTLARAARDDLDTEPAFALGSAMAALRWLSEGWGYEVTSADVVEAYDRVMDAASRLNKIDEVTVQIRQLVASKESASVLFVRQSLQGRMRDLSSVNEM